VFFPEFLYQLLGRDQQIDWLQVEIAFKTTAAAAAFIETPIYIVPPERHLILQLATVRVFAGAAQTSTRFEVLGRAPGGAAATARFLARDYAAVQTRFDELACSIVVPNRWQIVASGFFNAGVAVNTLDLTLFGMLIPAGNISRI
jgi:hypothetical protein